MAELLIDQDAVLVEQSNTVVVDSSICSEVIETAPVVQVHGEQFVLSSGDMYGNGNGLIGAVPNWLLDAIQQELTVGDGNITSVLVGMQSLIDGLQTGVSQAVTSINSLSLSTSGVTTALQSQVDSNNAAVLSVLGTKVTSAEAQALVASGIQSTFGTNATAFIGNIASTYVDANSAIAQDVSLLTTELNGVNASISEVALLTTEVVLNPLWVNDGFNTDPDSLGRPRYITRAIAKKQLVVDANGVITGYIAESGAISNFQINADNFSVRATGQSVASQNPFTVNATTGKISFNGVVDFTSTNASGTTTIDGSKITTGSINADRIDANTVNASNLLVNQTVRSSDFTTIGGAGFRLKSDAAGTYADPTIYGATVRAGTLYATTFDISSMQVIAGGNPLFTGSLFPSFYSSTYSGGAGALSVASDYFYGVSYGSGYLKNRVAKSPATFNLQLMGSANQGSTSVAVYVTAYYSINDGAWTQVGATTTMANFIPVVIALSNETIRFNAHLIVSGGIAPCSLSLGVQAPATA